MVGIVQSDSLNEKDCKKQTLDCFLGQSMFRIGNFIFSDVFENRYVATFDIGLINPLSTNNADSDGINTKKEWCIADIFAQTAHTTETDLFNTTYNSLSFTEAEVKIAGLLNLDIPCKTESIDRLKEKKNFESSYRVFRQKRKIEDPVRHYNPIMQGTKQNINVKVRNTGEEPLLLKDVFPSCGCTIAKFPEHAIAPGNDAIIELEYDSSKNSGYAAIYTTITANITEKSHTLFFDINVVPNSLHTKDYEELYFEDENKKDEDLRDEIDNDTNIKAYTVSGQSGSKV